MFCHEQGEHAQSFQVQGVLPSGVSKPQREVWHWWPGLFGKKNAYGKLTSPALPFFCLSFSFALPCNILWGQHSEVTTSQFSAAVLLTCLHYNPAGCINWAVGGVNTPAGWTECHGIPNLRLSFIHESWMSHFTLALFGFRLLSKGLSE